MLTASLTSSALSGSRGWMVFVMMGILYAPPLAA
jgi:hypothetical protein